MDSDSATTDGDEGDENATDKVINVSSTDRQPNPATPTKALPDPSVQTSGGGMRKKAEAIQTSDSETTREDNINTPRKSRVGRIGGKKLDAGGGIVSDATANDTKSSLFVPTGQTSREQDHSDGERPRESSRERADRKRETLKRELESKGQASGKKKRRF